MVVHKEILARPHDPAPLLDPTGSNKGGILLQVGFPGRAPQGAREPCLGRPGRPPGRFGLGPGLPGWVLGTGLG